MTLTLMTFQNLYRRSNLLITRIGQNINQSLALPVLQHLSYRLVRNCCALDGNTLLLSLIEREGYVKTLEDGVVSPTTNTVGQSLLSAIILRRECCFYAAAEEIERILQLVVGKHIEGRKHARRLHLHNQFLP